MSPPPPPHEPSHAASKLAATAKQVVAKYINTARRNKFDHLYSTLEDFERTDPDRRRLVVIGCTGAGKSTLLNVLSGWRFVQSKDNDFLFKWQDKPAPEGSDEPPAPPLFESLAGSESVTKITSFANVHMCGDPERELIVVDTPGHDDSAGCNLEDQEGRDTLAKLAADLHNKLKALGHVHAILVLHNDVVSNRLNPATYQILKMVDEKFSKAGTSVWGHVVVGYSKCNAHESTWRAGLEAKHKALREAIKAKVPNCDVDLPILVLGGGEIEPAPPSQDESSGVEQLWQFLANAPELDTSRLMPFEGVDVKIQKLIEERDQAAAQAKAAIIYIAVVLKLVCVLALLFWRHMMLPAWLSMLLLNLPGLYDELAIVAGVVYWIGPQDVLFSAKHFHRQWVQPLVRTYLGIELDKWDPSEAYSSALKFATRWTNKAGVCSEMKPKKE